MEKYKNLSGKSGVEAYEIGDDFIKVQFVNGSTYLYTNRSAGRETIAEMKALALAGEGLSSYISRVFTKGHASKIE